MSAPAIIGPEAGAHVSWADVTAALEAGHRLPKAQIADSFLRRGADTLLSRAAMIDGLGTLVKSATVFPGNPVRGHPMVNGAVTLFSDATGILEAVVDFHLVTRLKTAGDSLLAARHLAPPRVETVLVVGAGTVAESMIDAYRSLWPRARFTVWNRGAARAQALAGARGAVPVTDLAAAVREADVIATATMASEPVIRGDWLRPGQHLDLIGAYRADLREVDDTALRRARLFVDSIDTTLDHIGELKIPLEAGVIARSDVIADFYDLARFLRAPHDITICKNGGGAHLDLMVAREVHGKWAEAMRKDRGD